jgi:hypothetical protein
VHDVDERHEIPVRKAFTAPSGLGNCSADQPSIGLTGANVVDADLDVDVVVAVLLEQAATTIDSAPTVSRQLRRAFLRFMFPSRFDCDPRFCPNPPLPPGTARPGPIPGQTTCDLVDQAPAEHGEPEKAESDEHERNGGPLA